MSAIATLPPNTTAPSLNPELVTVTRALTDAEPDSEIPGPCARTSTAAEISAEPVEFFAPEDVALACTVAVAAPDAARSPAAVVVPRADTDAELATAFVPEVASSALTDALAALRPPLKPAAAAAAAADIDELPE